MTEAPPAWLVTGATGFLGRHLLETLRRDQPEARLLVLVRDLAAWNALPWRGALGPVEVITGGLGDGEPWWSDVRLEGVRGIFHLAAEVKHSRVGTERMLRTNVQGALAMVRLSARLRCRLLLVSTSGTVGCAPRPGQEPYEDAPYCEHVVGGWPYYASKIRAEREARALAGELGVELVVFRPPVMLGPGDHRFRSTVHVLRVLRRRLPFIVDGGMHFVDVRDAAAAMVRAMLLPRPQPVYHLAGTACSLRDFFHLVAAQAGLAPSWRVLPRALVWHAARLNQASGLKLHVIPDPVVVEMAGHHWELRSRHAESDLGYRARPAEETIADTITWLRRHHPELSAASSDPGR